MQKMSNGDYFDEKMRRGDRSKEARRISPPLKLLLKSPKLRGSTAPKSAHLHRGREQGALLAISGISLARRKSTDMKSVQDGAIKLRLKSNLALVRTSSPYLRGFAPSGVLGSLS